MDKESSCPLVPTSIVLKKIQGRTTLLNKAGSSHSRMSSKVTGGRDSDKIYEFDVPQFEGLQQAVLASLHDDFDDSALALTNTVWNTRDIDPVLRQDPFAIFEFGPDEDWFKEPDTDDCAAARGALPCTPRQSGWESTVVSSALSRTGSKRSVRGSADCSEDFRPVVSTVRWAEIAHEWSDFEYPLSIYWERADKLANNQIHRTLGPAMRLSVDAFPVWHETNWYEFQSLLHRAGFPVGIIQATQALRCMKHRFLGEAPLPLILSEILFNTLQWPDFPQVLAPTEEEKSQAVGVWRNLEADFHDDQLNLCEYYAHFMDDMRQLDIGLLCRGHLSLKEARIISHLVRNIANQVGEIQLPHDMRTSYLALLRGNELARYVFRNYTVPHDTRLPYQTSLMWKHEGITKDGFDIAHGSIKRFNSRCDEFGLLEPHIKDSFIGTMCHSDRTVLWGIRAWHLVSGDVKYIPHSGKKVILKSTEICVPNRRATQCERDEAINVWCNLDDCSHHIQLNLCKFFEMAGEMYLAAGLAAHTTLSNSQAEIIAQLVWKHMTCEYKSLFCAYRELWQNLKTLAARETVSKEDLTRPINAPRTGTRHKHTETADDTMHKRHAEDETEKPPERARCAESWANVLARGASISNYYDQLRRCVHLHEWCNYRWDSEHMSWEAFNEYEDRSLDTRTRLIYWLRRVWYTYYPGWGVNLHPSYDALLRRYVRDFGHNERWSAVGDANGSLDRWRKLKPVFHFDQQELCQFYAKVDPTFMQKGLQADNHLSSSDAANIISLLRQGAAGWKEGELSHNRIKELYAALLDNRYRLDEENEQIAYFRRLRIGKVLGQRAGPRRTLRTRRGGEQSLDDNAGVPTLPLGMKTRTVVNDCNGRVGIAKSTIHGAGEGGYALKRIKKDKPVGIYQGRHLKSKAEILEASRTSDYVYVCGDVAIDAKDSGSCTMRFLNDCLNPLLWNCTVKVVNGQVWVYATTDIEVGQELFLPYGYLYWWKRRHTLSSTLKGECARAYPAFSERLNDGHEKHSFSQKQQSKLAKSKPTPVLAGERKRELVNASMWSHFPSVRTTLNPRLYDQTTLKKMKKKGKLTASFLEWRRVPTAVRDTFEDMEDVMHTNAGMKLGNGEHDVKICTWNCGGLNDEKLETFALYMITNGMRVLQEKDQGCF